MSEQSVRVPVQKLVDFMETALIAMKIPGDDARIIADVLITSDLWGVRSHGIAHLKMYHERIQSGLQLPVTLVTGGLDDKFCALSAALAAKLPNGRHVVVKGHGHALLLEAPAAIEHLVVKE